MSKPRHRSQRFSQAATNERNRLVRKRAQLSQKREDLQKRLDALNEAYVRLLEFMHDGALACRESLRQ